MTTRRTVRRSRHQVHQLTADLARFAEDVLFEAVMKNHESPLDLLAEALREEHGIDANLLSRAGRAKLVEILDRVRRDVEDAASRELI